MDWRVCGFAQILFVILDVMDSRPAFLQNSVVEHRRWIVQIFCWCFQSVQLPKYYNQWNLTSSTFLLSHSPVVVETFTLIPFEWPLNGNFVHMQADCKFDIECWNDCKRSDQNCVCYTIWCEACQCENIYIKAIPFVSYCCDISWYT